MKLNNHKMMLITTVVLFSLGLGVYLAEGVNQSCVGGVIAGTHFRESDTKPPKIIRRCIRPDPNNQGETLWEGMPCTNENSPNACDGEGECIPTDKGGYCKMNSGGNKIYKDGVLKNTMFLGTSIDLEDPDSYEGDEDLDLSGEDLYERRRAERDQAIREKEEERYGNLGYTEQEALISDTQKILWWVYSIHIIFILLLSLALKDSLSLVMQSYTDTIYFKYRQFQGY